MRTVTGIIDTPVEFGLRDMSHPAFWFSVKFEESYGALIIMNVDKMIKLVTDNDIQNIKHLTGKPCWLEVNDNNIVTFKDLWK